MTPALPVVVIGAGPVGLAAAAHLLSRGLTPLVLEAGDVGAGMLRWAHVRMFSPWQYAIDREAHALLAQHGWAAPDLARFPTGGELVAQYLRPLAATPQLQPHVRTHARVTAVSRRDRDRMKDAQRDAAPFVVRYADAAGEHEILAQAVIDASGTVEHPNPLGASGLPALGERAAADRIFYGVPDVLGRDRDRYAGKRVLVVGSGHSAFNVLGDLARLAAQVPDTRIAWAIRQPALTRVLGGGEQDQLRERGRLGLMIGQLVADGVLEVTTGFHLDHLARSADGIVAQGRDQTIGPIDEIVAATGFRPDLGLLSELRIALDHGTQAPMALAPLIDPNLHSCGSVRPHGAEELRHPDAGVYIVGMKSYGRAPTFLLLTGYEQVRSVAAALAGDWEAARRVELVLPETGVCVTQFADDETDAASAACCSPASEPTQARPSVAVTSGCCGGPAPAGIDACCVRDAQAKADGAEGCGCGATAPPVKPKVVSCCQ